MNERGNDGTIPRLEPNSKRQLKTSVLAGGYCFNRATVAKWQVRTTTSDALMRPRHRRGAVFTSVGEGDHCDARRVVTIR